MLKRDDVIKLVADLVTNNDEYKHTVDLSNPELTVVVEIIKVHCVYNLYRRILTSYPEPVLSECSEGLPQAMQVQHPCSY